MPLSANLRLGSSSAPATPSSFPFPRSPRSPRTPSSTTPNSLLPVSPQLELQLDSSELVFRSLGGDQLNGEPVHLTGSILLHLNEATSFKHISLTLKAIARLEYFDALSGKRYHQEQTVFTNHSEFLPLCSDSTHTHTLQNGSHQFHFSIKLPPGLPASLRTFNGSGLIYYKLKAGASRHNNFLLKHPHRFEAKKFLRVSRSFPSEALEWSQTLDIENTWPGKISYEISLPRKAFAAGETIPITIKFTPLVKGVRVTSLVITIKEHVSILAKPGSAPFVENRDVAENRFEFRGAGSVQPVEAKPASGPDASRTMGTPTCTDTDLSSLGSRLTAVSTRNHDAAARELIQSRSRAASTGAQSSPEQVLEEHAEDSVTGELDRVFGVALPASTTPSHSVPPISVNHKVRFSAFISNPDGHTSELRCALPLHVLAAELLTEATLAAGGQGTNALVFGPSGALVETQLEGPSELPSYSDHVRDRLAPIASAANRPSLIPAPWSVATTPMASPVDSPSTSRRSSISHGYFPTMRRWNDPELARSLDPATDADYPASRGRSSLASSRASSRANSPSSSSTHPFMTAAQSAAPPAKFPLRLPKALARMAHQLSVTASHPPLPHNHNHAAISSKPTLPLAASPALPGSSTPSSSASASVAQDPAVVAAASGSSILPNNNNNNNKNNHNEEEEEGGEEEGHTEEREEEEEEGSQEDVLSRVPCYSVASRGSLGGGPVPISSLVGLPAYDDLD